MPPSRISMLGCGWLGRALARLLLASGSEVYGSTTAADKVAGLRDAGVTPFVVHCDPGVVGDRLSEFFSSALLVITLPFRRGLADPDVYRQQMGSVIAHWQPPEGQGRVLWTSSTSVYPPDCGEAREDVDFVPDTARARTLRAVEQDVLNCTKGNGTVVRLAGLYGGGRRIGGFLAGKTGVANPDQPVNLIHQDDAAGILAAIIRQGAWGEIFNACADTHPTRRALYTAAARAAGLPPPEFAAPGGGPGKIVLNDKVKSRLGYRFRHPDAMDDVCKGKE